MLHMSQHTSLFFFIASIKKKYTRHGTGSAWVRWNIAPAAKYRINANFNLNHDANLNSDFKPNCNFSPDVCPSIKFAVICCQCSVLSHQICVSLRPQKNPADLCLWTDTSAVRTSLMYIQIMLCCSDCITHCCLCCLVAVRFLQCLETILLSLLQTLDWVRALWFILVMFPRLTDCK